MSLEILRGSIGLEEFDGREQFSRIFPQVIHLARISMLSQR